MARNEPYGIERDIKILEGGSSKHSARLEGQFLGIFPSTDLEIETKEGREAEKGMIVKGVRDAHIRIDLDVKDIKKGKGAFDELLHVIGLDPRTANFDVLQVLEKVLRAFAKARFKNLAEVTFDGKKVYEHPELDFDLSALQAISAYAASLLL